MSGNQKSGDKQHQGSERNANGQGDGDMTVREAGQLGGHKGGQRERELVEKGHEAEQRSDGDKGRH